MAQISNLSTSLEDYLEIILQLIQEKGEARVKDIAARKSVVGRLPSLITRDFRARPTRLDLASKA